MGKGKFTPFPLILALIFQNSRIKKTPRRKMTGRFLLLLKTFAYSRKIVH